MVWSGTSFRFLLAILLLSQRGYPTFKEFEIASCVWHCRGPVPS